MTRKKTCAMFAVAILLTILSVGTRAGGFQLQVEAVTPSTPESDTKGAAFLIRTFGCMKPTDATVRVTAEGLVDGKRESIPVKLRVADSGVYVVDKQWPDAGAWVLVVNGSLSRYLSSVLVELGRDGAVMKEVAAGRLDARRLPGKQIRRKFSKAEVDQALSRLAGLDERPFSEPVPEKAGVSNLFLGGAGIFSVLAGAVLGYRWLGRRV